MSILILGSLLGIGLILLMAEILFVPGTTVVGIFGLVISLSGIAYAFLTFSPETTLGGSLLEQSIINLAAVVYWVSPLVFGINFP